MPDDTQIFLISRDDFCSVLTEKAAQEFEEKGYFRITEEEADYVITSTEPHYQLYLWCGRRYGLRLIQQLINKD